MIVLAYFFVIVSLMGRGVAISLAIVKVGGLTVCRESGNKRADRFPTRSALGMACMMSLCWAGVLLLC